MRNKNVLLITYYWPPLGGASVQRWLKFIKYLSLSGYKCHVYTPENPNFDTIDESLVNEIPDDVIILKSRIWEPHSLFGKVKNKLKPNKKSSQKKTLKHKIGHWIRGNVFIPDSRVFWVKPSIKLLNEYITQNDIHTVITTGPPHSMHLIGLGLKDKNTNLNWIADFRDPWSEWEKYLNEFYPTGLSLKLNKRLEKKVLKTADEILTISPTYAVNLERIANRKIKVITNGFDEDDFKNYNSNLPKEEFVIRHIGTIDLRRNPIPFLKKLNTFLSKNKTKKTIRFEFIGNVDVAIKQEIEMSDWNYSISFISYIPHSEIIKYYEKTSALVLILASGANAKGNIPGKLFEYLASKIPIIGMGDPDGDSASIINEINAGKVFHHQQSQEDFNTSFSYILNKEINSNNQSEMIYSRENLTKKLIESIMKSSEN